MKKKWLLLIAIALSSVVIGIAIKNIICNDTFWEFSISESLGLLIGVWISFFIVERQTDKRRQKELFVDLLLSLKLIIDEKSTYDFSAIDKAEMLMRMREIGLKIDLITNYSQKFDVEEAVKQLSEKFNEYQLVIDNHSTDMDLLVKLKPELLRPLNLMSQQITKIVLSLFD